MPGRNGVAVVALLIAGVTVHASVASTAPRPVTAYCAGGYRGFETGYIVAVMPPDVPSPQVPCTLARDSDSIENMLIIVWRSTGAPWITVQVHAGTVWSVVEVAASARLGANRGSHAQVPPRSAVCAEKPTASLTPDFRLKCVCTLIDCTLVAAAWCIAAASVHVAARVCVGLKMLVSSHNRCECACHRAAWFSRALATTASS